MLHQLVRALAVFALVVTSAPTLVAGVVAAAAPGTGGGLAVTSVDPTGTTLTEACLELWTDAGGGTRGTLVAGSRRCDTVSRTGKLGGVEDGLPDGSLGWSGLAPGKYVVVEVTAPGDATGAYAPAADRDVRIVAGAASVVRLEHLALGALTLRKTDPAGAPLAGACFGLLLSGQLVVTQCDSAGPAVGTLPAGDGRPDGILVFRVPATVRDSRFTLREVRPPDGYAAASDQPVQVSGKAATELTVANTTGGGSGVVVTSVDPVGGVLLGACYELWTDAGGGSRGTLVTGSRHCDAASPNAKPGSLDDGLPDGSLSWPGLPAARYVVVETQPLITPAGTYALSPDIAIGAPAGRVTSVAVEHRLLGSLTVRTTDAAGALVDGACLELRGGSGPLARCDGAVAPAGFVADGAADGVLVLFLGTSRIGGTYTIHETLAPAGQALAADETVAISEKTAAAATLTHPAGTGGGLAVTSVDPTGTTLTEACLELWTDAGGGTRGTLVAGSRRCDTVSRTGKLGGVEDGLPDGSLGWSGLAPGKYVVVEVTAPGDATGAYAPAADRDVRIVAGAASVVRLEHLALGALTLRKTDPAGAPLAGACFGLLLSGQLVVTQCDSAGPAVGTLPAGDGRPDGILVFRVPATVRDSRFTLREVRPPDGYAAASDQPVQVSGKAATELTVANTTGGGSGVVEITSLELEIDSTIEIRMLNGVPVANGVATAKGRVTLEPDGGGGWRGTGTLASKTTSVAGGCPSIEVNGEGTYDWVVRAASVAPDLAAADISVSMDSGPTNETPDTFVADFCTDPFNGTLNTWENLFFDTYRSRFGGAGFLVEGWDLTSRDAWTTGGLVAEATWTGRCGTSLVVDCTDQSTFRLFAQVSVVAATPGPSDGSGGSGVATSPGASDGAGSSPVPAEGGGLVPTGPASSCGDLLECLGGTTVLVIAVAGLALVGGLAWLLFGRTAAPAWPQKFQSTDLPAGANEVPIAPIDVGEGGINFEKHPPEALTIETSFEKHPPDGYLGELPIEDLATSVDPGGDIKLGDIKLGYIKLGTEPLDTALGGELPPPPGTTPPGGGGS